MTLSEIAQYNDVAITVVGAAGILLYYFVGKRSAAERRKEEEAKRKAELDAAAKASRPK